MKKDTKVSGQTPKTFGLKDVAKYITPNSGVDNLSIKHQIAQKHQIDMDKMCQCHLNKQEHNMSTRARTRTTITTTSHLNIRSTSNHPAGRRRTTITATCSRLYEQQQINNNKRKKPQDNVTVEYNHQQQISVAKMTSYTNNNTKIER